MFGQKPLSCVLKPWLKLSWAWKYPLWPRSSKYLRNSFSLFNLKNYLFKNGLSLSLVGFHVSFASTESSIKVIFNLICRQRCFFCFGRCCLKLKLIGSVLSFHLRGIDPVIVEREWERKKPESEKETLGRFCWLQRSGSKRQKRWRSKVLLDSVGIEIRLDARPSKTQKCSPGGKITKKFGRN